MADQKLKDVAEDVADKAKDVADDVADQAKDLADDVADKTDDVATDISKNVDEGAEKITSAAGHLVDAASDAGRSVGSRAADLYDLHPVAVISAAIIAGLAVIAGIVSFFRR